MIGTYPNQALAQRVLAQKDFKPLATATNLEVGYQSVGGNYSLEITCQNMSKLKVPDKTATVSVAAGSFFRILDAKTCKISTPGSKDVVSWQFDLSEGSAITLNIGLK